MTAKKLTKTAFLTSVSLVTFMIEAQIPIPVRIPGIKLGLSNIITLFALFDTSEKDRLTAYDAFLILMCRIILSATLTGRAASLIYSAAGGLFAFVVMATLRRFMTQRQICLCAAFGAAAHNTAQIAAAVFLLGTVTIAAYLPVLIIIGILTGLLTGFLTELIIKRLNKWG